jgi:hypothetical protein
MRRLLIGCALVVFTSCVSALQQDVTSNNSGGGCNSGGGFGGGGGGGGGGGPAPTIDLRLNAPVPTNHGFPNGTYTVIDELAAGGTSDIRVQVANADLTSYADYDRPYLAVSEQPSTLSILGTEGAVVTVLAVQATVDSVTLVIDDAAAGGRVKHGYFIAPIASIHAAPTSEVIAVPEYHGGYATHVVYPAGTVEFAIALLDDAPTPHRLIDTSLLVTGATPTGWDTAKLVDATTGHHTVTVRTGDGRVTDLDVEVVAGPDRMIVLDNNPTYACFAALAGDAFVAGLTWSYAVGGTPVTPGLLGPNCVYKHGIPSGTLTATAGATSLSITL